jgi:hypothetical protein
MALLLRVTRTAAAGGRRTLGTMDVINLGSLCARAADEKGLAGVAFSDVITAIDAAYDVKDAVPVRSRFPTLFRCCCVAVPLTG